MAVSSTGNLIFVAFSDNTLKMIDTRTVPKANEQIKIHDF